MDLPDPDCHDPQAWEFDPTADSPPTAQPEGPNGAIEAGWLEEIVGPLAGDPRECWLAMEALGAFEPVVRRAIIVELSGRRSEPGIGNLLRLLCGARDPSTQAAARAVLGEAGCAPVAAESMGRAASALAPRSTLASSSQGGEHEVCSPPSFRPLTKGGLVGVPSHRLVRSFVTPVDGRGRGSVVVSVSREGQRRTAAFWCDVMQGIRDVVGDVEPDSPAAGRLLDDFVQQAGADAGCAAPELALGLLGGNSRLCGPAGPGPVRDWLDGLLDPGFQPPGLPAILLGLEAATVPDEELAQRAHQVLEACPSWRDDSALIYELAQEIQLREGPAAADPDRDAGAYRFLFEHRLIHRLELYRRMLLWMAWLWQCSGRNEPARSALILACQLSDEQYAVPSHPFTVALTTRSLEAARTNLGTAHDPRRRG